MGPPAPSGTDSGYFRIVTQVLCFYFFPSLFPDHFVSYLLLALFQVRASDFQRVNSWLSLPVPPALVSFHRTGSGLPGRSSSAKVFPKVFPLGTFSFLQAHLWTLYWHSTSASSSKQGRPSFPEGNDAAGCMVLHPLPFPTPGFVIEYPSLERTYKDQQVQLSLARLPKTKPYE